ncbi:345_t:CDS:1 [Paraglomus occultum]|uniref:345_t:CDS:1 n=1 Tax=Paraglomus occultum TaxID=144539 RepID=A0A9N9HAU3_9GLOM|nr:345_t:CDS:1 [Paraglomus occultum]
MATRGIKRPHDDSFIKSVDEEHILTDDSFIKSVDEEQILTDDSSTTIHTSTQAVPSKKGRTKPKSSDENTNSSKRNRKKETNEKSNKSVKWTTKQRMQLLNAVLKRVGTLNWKDIAEEVDEKDMTSCRQQWNRKIIPDLKKAAGNGIKGSEK